MTSGALFYLLSLSAIGAVTCECEGLTIVVGAGVAGLSAAAYLQAHGCEVVVLEARARIGGRTYTVRTGAFAGLDVGAHWVHGGRNNIITSSYADYYNLTRIAVGGDSSYEGERDMLRLFDKLEKRWLSADEVSLTFDQFALQMELCTKYYKHRKRHKQSDVSMADAFRHINTEASMNFSAFSTRCIEWHHTIKFEGDEGVSSAALSLFQQYEADYVTFYPSRHNEVTDGGMERRPNGDQVVVGGYRMLVDKLAAGLTIHTSTVVHGVTYSSDGITVATSAGSMHAARAIVTLPLGVLQNRSVEFTPPLRAKKLKAIDSLDMGRVTKVLVQYDEAPWPRTYSFGVIDYNKSHYGQWANGINAQFEGANKSVLHWYVGGPQALLLEAMTDEQLRRHVSEEMALLFGEAARSPAHILASKWHSEPESRGAWMSMPVGSSMADFLEYARPESDERLLFAGEASCKLLYGTVHGAIVSGLREAYRVVGAGTEKVAGPWVTASGEHLHDMCEKTHGRPSFGRAGSVPSGRWGGLRRLVRR